MTKDVTQGPESQLPPTENSWPMTVLQFAKEYFVLVSALVVVTGVFLATVFLYGYLSVFDWHLIWIVQYQDILTFALVAVGLVAGFSTLVPIVLQTLQTGFTKENLVSVLAGVSGIIIVLGLSIFAEYSSPDPHYQRFVFAGMSITSLVGLAIFISVPASFPRWPGPLEAAWIFAFGILVPFSLGQCLGYYILEERGLGYDIYMKNETLAGARIVMATSHHMIVYSNKIIYIVPTNDVNVIIEHKPR
jgi:hypothetical protein